MSDSQLAELVLSCGSWQEAQRIADHLLEQRLAARIEFMEVQSKDWWQRQLEGVKEIKLIVESLAENFGKIEAEIGKIQSLKA